MTTFWKGIEKKDTKIHPFQKGVLFTDINNDARIYVCTRVIILLFSSFCIFLFH